MADEFLYTTEQKKHIEELTSSYVLGALTEGEENFTEFESFIETGNPVLASALEQLFESSVILAQSVVEYNAPDDLRTLLIEKIKHFESIHKNSSEITNYNSSSPRTASSSKKKNRLLIGGGILTGLLLCLLLAINVSKTAKLDRSVDLLQSMLKLNDSLKAVNRSLRPNDSVITFIFNMVQDEETRFITMREASGKETPQHLFFNQKQKLIAFLPTNTRSLESDKDYELWAFSGKEASLIGKFRTYSEKNLPIYTFPFNTVHVDSFGISPTSINAKSQMLFVGNVSK